MEAFLDKLAKHLYESHSDNFSRICLVFPSRRAGLFFKQYLSGIIDKPIWLPDIYALEDFVVFNSGLKLSDPLSLIARLYKVYKSIEKDKAQSFSEFISWGNMLLNDFDEIDQYLADGEKVFSFLDEIKAMKHWNPDGTPLTPFETDYLRFYNSLAPCYKLFREDLLSAGEGYFGLAFDVLLKDIENKSFTAWDSIVFAGFNALTAAEEKLLKCLVETGKAEIYWDADEYYLSDKRQEAGHFIREYIEKNTFGPLNWISNSLSVGNKTVSMIGIPGNVGQAKLAGELIQEIIARKGSADGIALVLVDEGLLLPVLNSLPAESGDFNVTMGFPLKQTPVFSLIITVLSLFSNAKRFAKPVADPQPESYPDLRFYYKDIQRLLSHPFIIAARKNNFRNSDFPDGVHVDRSFYTAEDFRAQIANNNIDLAAVFNPYLDKKKMEPADILELIKDIISFLHTCFSHIDSADEGRKSGNQPIEVEYLYHASVLCSKLDVILHDPVLMPDVDTVQSLVNSLIAGMRLPFYGEPLNGLQVMGMLETRMLDFTDIVMISVNEGLLPRGKHQTTFIPDEVRAQFGMQRYKERTAVFAYHFYRLMQRVENAWLIYNTEGDELGGGEKSRFLSQFLHEMPGVNPNIQISEQILSVVPGNVAADGITVRKSNEIVSRLRMIAARGLSPTAIAMYLKCSLQFYFSQVLRISEPEQVSETVDAATLGEIVHEALHKTYGNRKKNLITPEIINAMLAEANENVKAAFASRFQSHELSTGKNLLIVRVAWNMVKRFLLAEKRHLEQQGSSIEILMLEENLTSFVEIADTENGEIFKVNLHGKADRIDRVGGIVRIIDYKTGKVEPKDLKIELISDIQEKNEPGKLLQVLTYALMYSGMQAVAPEKLISGIISLRKSSSYLIRTYIDKVDFIDKSLLEAFNRELKMIVSDIFNTAIPFSQTQQRDTCAICAFNTICNRVVA